MQKQWGLFFGAVVLYAATIGLVFVAGPDPYPVYGSRTGVTTWVPREAQVFRDTALYLALIVGPSLYLALPPSWSVSNGRPTRTRAYWATHPEAFPAIRERNIRDFVTVIAFAAAVRNVLILAFPGAGVLQGPVSGLCILGIALVMITRCVIRLRPPKDFRIADGPTTGVSSEAPSGTSGRSASPGS